ncbi:hypothetical protein M409DRAFT_26599 [Zasmidium cellare ATCC 36951]|uniref:AB hydrolase-1 domain-containing protein n=1 Tax=Zasmidium cellare ATCC 36951 TaxID=1080233 RepID=A0A6A6CCH7_ZASCE|nr:uncharacterized protein M409DRAFT_26599 [Zasmidium cellare ATCC 36951]KAF2163156.1 hypothetical protein M409DRAFT_26599 [Zasmidium cellare ATCC 36951]
MKPNVPLFLSLHLASPTLSISLPTNQTSLTWHKCPTSSETNAGLDCAELRVPLDWSNPNDGETITLSMNRWPAKDPAKKIGTLVYNPGGPGISATDSVVDFASGDTYFGEALRGFDLIGLDPRGAGRSTPIKCSPDLWNARPSQFVHTEQDFANLVQYNRDFALSCLNRTGNLVKHIDTPSVARDIDALRIALGEEKINFYGQSYGTQIGESYAELFPRNFRAMVLDGNVDHSLTEIPTVVSEAYGYEVVWNRFVAWCNKTEDCVLRGQDINAQYTKLLDAAFQSPLEVPECEDPDSSCRPSVRLEDITGTVQSTLDSKFVPAGYDQDTPTWRSLAKYLSAAFKGDYSDFAPEIAENETSPLWQMQLVNCLDWEHNAASAADLIHQTQFMFTAAPHTRGTAQAYAVNSMCAGWPFAVPDPPHRLVVEGNVAPVFLLNSLYDPETPFDQAVGLQRQLPGSVLVAVREEGHTSYQYAGEAARLMEAYLVNLTLPEPDTVVDS